MSMMYSLKTGSRSTLQVEMLLIEILVERILMVSLLHILSILLLYVFPLRGSISIVAISVCKYSILQLLVGMVSTGHSSTDISCGYL